MKYNILFVANDQYFKLLYICLKSLLMVCNLYKVDKIFVADLGLKETNKTRLTNLHSKITLIDTNKNIDYSDKLYSKEWIEAVSQKTSLLLDLVNNNNIPIIMIDSDTLITDDFSDTIDLNYDLQICKRTNSFTRADGLLVQHIASFVVINNLNAISFIESWIKRMEERIKENMIPPHETPAMVETISGNVNLKIGDLDENIISCDNNYIDNLTKIIHAKSRTKKDKISIYRYTNITNLPLKIINNILINKHEILTFSFLYKLKKVFNIYKLKQFIKKILKK